MSSEHNHYSALLFPFNRLFMQIVAEPSAQQKEFAALEKEKLQSLVAASELNPTAIYVKFALDHDLCEKRKDEDGKKRAIFRSIFSLSNSLGEDCNGTVVEVSRQHVIEKFEGPDERHISLRCIFKPLVEYYATVLPGYDVRRAIEASLYAIVALADAQVRDRAFGGQFYGGELIYDNLSFYITPTFLAVNNQPIFDVVKNLNVGCDVDVVKIKSKLATAGF